MYSEADCCGENGNPPLAGVPFNMSTLTIAGPTNAHVGMVKLIVYVCVLLLVARLPVAAGAFLKVFGKATGTCSESKIVAVK